MDNNATKEQMAIKRLTETITPKLMGNEAKEIQLVLELRSFLVHIELIKNEFEELQNEHRENVSYDDFFRDRFASAAENLHYIDNYILEGIDDLPFFSGIKFEPLADKCVSALSRGAKNDFDNALDSYAGTSCRAYLLNL